MAEATQAGTGLASFRACHRYARISPRKARLVIDMVRGQPVNRALEILRYSKKRGAHLLNKVVRSALANAENAITEKKLSLDVDTLYVTEARVDEGPRLKRWRPRSRGMVHPYQRRTSHLSVVLAGQAESEG